MSSCFTSPLQIQSIRQSVSRLVLLSLGTSLVLSLLDYSNVTFAALPGHLLDRRQSVLNAVACMIFSVWQYDRVMSLLHELH